MFAILLVYSFLQGTSAVIYRLNASEHARLPPLMHMDSYENCQLDADALYCSAAFVLVSDESSPLLDIIKEYAEHRATHYNRTKLRYGICVTQTCKKFYKKENEDLNLTLEVCLNESLSEKYALKSKIIDLYYCNPPSKPMNAIDRLDIIVGAVCVIILLASLVGSLCDIFFEKNKENRALRFLLCFSLKRNWHKLVAPVAVGRDVRLERLKSFHGIRVVNIGFVIIAHSMFIVMTAVQNPEFIEEIYTTFPFNVVINGSLIIQTFLMSSAFLLVYNWNLYSEEHKPSWYMLPKHIIIRFLRLTPTYALIIALSATWFGHLSSGPLWAKYVSLEMYDCRKYWWRHLLYINNYFNDSQCMAHTWYLAADTHLYCFAIIIYLACRTARSREITLSFLFVIGMIIPAVYVYLQDLDGIQMASPELAESIFTNDPYFNTVYKRSHTNIPGYVIGIALGYLVYYWQQQGVDVQRYKTLPYRLLYWSLFPLCLLCVAIGIVFYADAPRTSIYLRVACTALLRPIFSLIVAGLIIGFIFKFEDVYRCLLEWRGWTVFSRLSYCGYLLHVTFIKNYVGMQTHTNQIGFIDIIEVALAILIVTVLAAFFLWMFVEAPVSNLIFECLLKQKTKEKIDCKKKPTHSDTQQKKEDV